MLNISCGSVRRLLRVAALSNPAFERTLRTKLRKVRSLLSYVSQVILPANCMAQAIRFVLGDDIFISYSRKDGLEYSLALATSLEGLKCFIDQYETLPGESIPEVVTRHLQRATVLVLVGTPEAVQSAAVLTELELFIASGRTVIPITFAGAIEGSPMSALLKGLPLTRESLNAASSGIPSPSVKLRVQGSFAHLTYSKRMRRLAYATLGIGLLATGGTLAARYNAALAAERDAKCAEARSGLESHEKNQEYMTTWQADWERDLSAMEERVRIDCKP